MNIEEIYKLVLREYQAYYVNGEKITKLDEFSKLDATLNQFAHNDSSIKVIFDNINYRIISISDNLERISGYTKKDFEKLNILLLFKALILEHLLAPVVIARWSTKVVELMSNIPDCNHQELNFVMCGLKVRPKNGKKMQIMVRATPIEISDKGYPIFCLVSLDDISHLLKSDFYWGRMSYGDASPYKFHIISKDKKYNKTDILSDREKEVIKLVADGLESKEIAELLVISANTVDNHRKNALARTGAKDTTALIQLCRMLGMI